GDFLLEQDHPAAQKGDGPWADGGAPGRNHGRALRLSSNGGTTASIVMHHRSYGNLLAGATSLTSPSVTPRRRHPSGCESPCGCDRCHPAARSCFAPRTTFRSITPGVIEATSGIPWRDEHHRCQVLAPRSAAGPAGTPAPAGPSAGYLDVHNPD